MNRLTRKRIWSFLALAAMVLVPIGCTPTDREEGAEKQAGAPPSDQGMNRSPYGQEGLAQAHFDADPLLLGFSYEDSTLGLRFAPPRGWAPVDAQQFTRIRTLVARFYADSGKYRSRPEKIFFDEGRLVFMILASFEDWPSPANPFLALPDYRVGVDQEMPDMTIQADLFQLGPIAFYQLQMSNEIAVDRRLLLIREGHLPVRVDYIMPRKQYGDLVSSIEASIGSFQPLGR